MEFFWFWILVLLLFFFAAAAASGWGHTRIGGRIVTFWSEPRNQRAAIATWTAHRDIKEVMLATALLDTYVGPAERGPVSKARPAAQGPYQA